MNDSRKTISLVIPVYNEAQHLERFLKLIDGIELPCDKELVFVDDCSKDGSAAIIKGFPFKSKVQTVFKPVNEGKGAALRSGFALATGDIVCVQDADFEYDPRDLPTLILPLLSDRADVVFGSRFKKNAPQVHRTFHYLINRFLTILSNFSSGLYLTDMETCYKLFKARIIKNIVLESNRFGFEPEVTAKVACLKVRVEEYPIAYYPRNYIEGKKITWRDGVAALRHILYFNFVADKRKFFTPEMPKDYIPQANQWL
ncbi:MAG: glycosyltransferase family 2 protein [Deltaproteobacteria bacterium]|nr:glycosyltransferase family 2 protein [Deltaproteobacteria bacterium]